jgi:hypothetical protein
MANIKPFIVRGDIVNGLVNFPLDGLNFRQKDFVRSCQTTINVNQIPKMSAKPTAQDSVAVVAYWNENDFIANLMVGVETTPDAVWTEMLDMFNNNKPVTKGDFIPDGRVSERLFPNMEAHKHKANNDWFTQMGKMSNDNAIMASPDNSYPTLKRDNAKSGWIVA